MALPNPLFCVCVVLTKGCFLEFLCCRVDLYSAKGLQLGVVNINNINKGVTLGIYNQSKEVRGLQIGLINRTHTLRGVQIGLININKWRFR